VNSREAIQRLRAHQAGRPLPKGEKRSVRVPDPRDVLVLAFVRMGGESRPWGVAFGHPGGGPTVLTVPEGRDRTQVAEMMLRAAPVLLGHLRSPALAPRLPGGPEDLAPIRQIWLPNSSHLEMLLHLAYAYTFTRSGDDVPSLNALGRACAWMFRESQRPGEQHVIIATAALRDAFTFPAETVRQGHLGFLLAWLDSRGDGKAALARAHDEERLSMSTTLDPSTERRELEPLVERWRTASKQGADSERFARGIHSVLAEELTRRFDLTVRAWQILHEDPRRENIAVEDLVEEALTRQWWDWARTEVAILNGEQGFVPSVETDRQPASAASAYERASAAAEILGTLLVHDDKELFAEAVGRGDAFVGTIVGVRDEGEGRRTLPVWTVERQDEGPSRLREGSHLCLIGLPKRTLDIRTIYGGPGEPTTYELAITNLRTAVRGASGQAAIAPCDRSWIGERLAFTTASMASIAFRKQKKLRDQSVPGAWLTFSAPPDDRTHRPNVDEADADETEADS
jgi:hypothetical protein